MLRTRQSSRRGFRAAARRETARFRPALEGLETRVLLDAGALDPTFGKGGQVGGDFGREVYAGAGVAAQPDGKVVVVGTVQSDPFAGIIADRSNLDFFLARYNPDGALDPTFGKGGTVVTDFGGDDLARGLVLQEDGKIVVAGGSARRLGDIFADFNFALARYNADGSLDTSFGVNGRVTTDFDGREDFAAAVALQADGKIVVAGSSTVSLGFGTYLALARYDTEGGLDADFGGGGTVLVTTPFHGTDNSPAGVAIQSDGKIMVAGTASSSGLAPVFLDPAVFVARFQADGSLDADFGQGGAVVDSFTDSGAFAAGLALQADGKIVVAATSSHVVGKGPLTRGVTDFALARYGADGTLDAGFGTGGRVFTDFGSDVDQAATVALQGDGKIVVAGWSQSDPGDPSSAAFALARYGADGSLDAGFGSGGLVTTDFGGRDAAGAVAVQADGNIVVAGDTRANDGTGSTLVLARYLGADPAPATGSLRGRVFEHFCPSLMDPKEGLGLGGLRGAAGVTVRLGDRSAVTGADGSYVFEGVPPGTYTVGVFVAGYGEARGQVTILPGGESHLDFTLPFVAPGVLLVQFVPGTTQEQVLALSEFYGIVQTYRPAPLLLPDLWVLRIPQGTFTQDFIDAYRREPLVRSVTRDELLCLH